MPCGGIYPIMGTFTETFLNTENPSHRCFYRGKAVAVSGRHVDHFCDEWDCYLHRECVEPFLTTEEGQIVIRHKHDVVIRDELGDLVVLYEQGIKV